MIFKNTATVTIQLLTERRSQRGQTRTLGWLLIIVVSFAKPKSSTVNSINYLFLIRQLVTKDIISILAIWSPFHFGFKVLRVKR